MMELIEHWRKAWQLRSVQVAGVGGALALGLAASSTVVPWLGLLPVWAVFAGGAVVCALTVWARLAKQKPRRTHFNKHGRPSKWR
ncbi:MAG: hypothetical protein ABI268_09910 [Rhodanobacter sp.]